MASSIEPTKHSGNADKQIAVLIDADNAQAAVLDAVLQEMTGYGELSVRRIYGDSTSPHSAQWRTFLNQRTIKPIQQFSYSTGKNATDCAMIIDAMDLLHSVRFDGFCLVTSDSDCTSLAERIREHGLRVYGVGKERTPEAFRKACHKFIFTENLRKTTSDVGLDVEAAEPSSPNSRSIDKDLPELPLEFITTALEQSIDDSGWSHLGTFGSNLGRLIPDFDSRTYGHKKLSGLMKCRTDLFSVELRDNDLYVRAKTDEADG